MQDASNPLLKRNAWMLLFYFLAIILYVLFKSGLNLIDAFVCLPKGYSKFSMPRTLPVIEGHLHKRFIAHVGGCCEFLASLGMTSQHLLLISSHTSAHHGSVNYLIVRMFQMNANRERQVFP